MSGTSPLILPTSRLERQQSRLFRPFKRTIQTPSQSIQHGTNPRTPTLVLQSQQEQRHDFLQSTAAKLPSQFKPLPPITLSFQDIWEDVEIAASDPQRTCSICSDTKNGTHFPRQKVTAGCDHENTVCCTCLKIWLRTQICDQGNLGVRCVECPSGFGYEDVKRFADEETFERYDTLLTRHHLSTLPTFHWCTNPTCKNGSFHCPQPPSPPNKYTCTSCAHTHCIAHGVPWLTHHSCTLHDQQDAQNRASEEWKRRRTRRCPRCGAWIQKRGGCDSMVCAAPGCRRHFYWYEVLGGEEEVDVEVEVEEVRGGGIAAFVGRRGRFGRFGRRVGRWWEGLVRI